MGKSTGLQAGLLLSASLSLSSCKTSHPLVEYAHSKKIKPDIVANIKTEVKKYTDENGRVNSELQSALYEIEKSVYGTFSEEAQIEYQDLVASLGGKMRNSLKLPKDDTPFWLMNKNDLTAYRSSSNLPKHAHVVIVGAGLTGASAAYHLSDLAKEGQTVVVLEAEEQPASQASGRNGGNFQLLSESYVGTYEGIVEERVKWLKQTKPSLGAEEIQTLAKKYAQVLVNFSLHNFDRFRSIVSKEKIDCDFTEAGWLRVASTEEEERSLVRDTEWLSGFRASNMPKMEIWSPETVKSKLGFETKFSARFIAKNGNYHPFKFVTGLLKRSLAKGVKFYTGVRVEKISNKNGKVLVRSSQGLISADKVIVATNAQTPKLFPKLKSIVTVPSQIMNLEHVEDDLQGLTLTERKGDIYYNVPSSTKYKDGQGKMRGMVHFGLDFHTPSSEANIFSRSESHYLEMKTITDERFPSTRGQPASRVWAGPMAFTADRVPVIGFMNSKNVILAAAFQGYGGSYCTQAGYVAAQMAVTGQEHEDVPAQLFSPLRFSDSDPAFRL